MKKYLLGLAVLLMGTAVMTSCDPAEDDPETYLQVYSTGAYVVNSGNMYSKIESSLTAIDYASSTATQNVFKTANGRTLGNTANDGIVYGNKIYLAVDQSNTIEVIDKKTKQIINLAKDGDVSKINLLIGDISAKPLPGLPMNATASLFSNAKANASREDIAMGLIWMVLQSIGSATILSSLESGIKDFVLIGNLTLLPQCREVFPAMEKLYGVRFRIPKYSEFCTAIGAALDYKRQTK